MSREIIYGWIIKRALSRVIALYETLYLERFWHFLASFTSDWIFISQLYFMHIFLRCLKKKNPINQSRFLCCKFSIYWVVVNSGKVLGIYCKSWIQSIGKHKYYLTSTSRYIFTLPNSMYNDTKYTFQYISVAPTNYVHYFVCVDILSLFYFVFFLLVGLN